jgi:hypothetical protein
VRTALYGLSGDSPKVSDMVVKEGQRFLGSVAVGDRLPGWITDADVDFYSREFERTGFTGALGWYRNIDRNWQLTAPWQGATVSVPAL